MLSLLSKPDVVIITLDTNLMMQVLDLPINCEVVSALEPNNNLDLVKRSRAKKCLLDLRNTRQFDVTKIQELVGLMTIICIVGTNNVLQGNPSERLYVYTQLEDALYHLNS